MKKNFAANPLKPKLRNSKKKMFSKIMKFVPDLVKLVGIRYDEVMLHGGGIFQRGGASIKNLY